MKVITDKDFPKKKVLFADLDGTLIETVTGKTFPCGIWDMKIKFDVLDAIKSYGFECLIIITNQGGIEKGFVNEKHFVKGKMSYLIKAFEEYLGIPVEYQYCASNDKECEYRKPNVGMLKTAVWKFIASRWNMVIDKSEMLMIGDGSGGERWSDTDLKTAENYDIDYVDVDVFVSLNK